MASTYVAGGDLEYGRYGNPTWTAFEDALGALEGGRCLSYASGMARGHHPARPGRARRQGGRAAGTPTTAPWSRSADLELRGRLTTTLVDITDTAAVVEACEDAALVWFESPTNPALEVADVPAIIAAAHDAGARVVVDNTFLTPLLQQPLELGADVVLHSATKYLAGHSDVQLGAVVTRDEELYAVLKGRRDVQGNTPGPVRGLARAARAAHPAPARRARPGQRRRARPPPRATTRCSTEVRYPGLGGMVSIVLPTADHADLLVRSTVAVGARHQPRRRRVDVRAPPPLEVRARDHPRGTGPPLGRHRGRRGPLGRPVPGAGRLTAAG